MLLLGCSDKHMPLSAQQSTPVLLSMLGATRAGTGVMSVSCPTLLLVAACCCSLPGLPVAVKDLTPVKGLPFTQVCSSNQRS